MKKKTYYYPLGEDRRWKSYYPISKLIRCIGRNIKCHGYEVIGKENIPTEASFFCPNHARATGPIAMDYAHKRPNRVWSQSRMLEIKEFPKQIVNNVIPNKKGIVYGLLYGLASVLAIPFTRLMLSYDPIPVYKDTRILNTFKKSARTIGEGKDIVMYPEWKTRAEGYKYVNQVMGGIAVAVKECVRTCKRPISIVPVYVCESLRKVIYCKPITIENTANYKEQTQVIIKYIMDAIEEAGNSLPEHRITPYDDTYKAEEKEALKQQKKASK